MNNDIPFNQEKYLNEMLEIRHCVMLMGTIGFCII